MQEWTYSWYVVCFFTKVEQRRFVWKSFSNLAKIYDLVLNVKSDQHQKHYLSCAQNYELNQCFNLGKRFTQDDPKSGCPSVSVDNDKVLAKFNTTLVLQSVCYRELVPADFFLMFYVSKPEIHFESLWFQVIKRKYKDLKEIKENMLWNLHSFKRISRMHFRTGKNSGNDLSTMEKFILLETNLSQL